MIGTMPAFEAATKLAANARRLSGCVVFRHSIVTGRNRVNAVALKSRCLATGLLAALAIGATSPVLAQDAVADFYKGKTVAIVVNTAGGTGYDYGARVLARHFGGAFPAIPRWWCRTARVAVDGPAQPISIRWRHATEP